ncbi:flagellar biosynthesis protein FlhF [Paenibacillus sp. TH7-28]
MRVKRYIVDEMPDAMLKIRSELGVDAVILSTKEMKVGGIFGLFGKKKIEVIAATEGNEASSPKTGAARPTPQAPAPVARRAVPEAYRKTSQLGAAAASPSSSTAANAALAAIALQEREEPPAGGNALPLAPERAPFSLPAPAVDAAPVLDKPNYRREPAPLSPAMEHSSTTAASAADSREERLLEDIRQMKMWLSQLAKNQEGGRELPQALQSIQNQLFGQEVSADLCDSWIEEVYQEWVGSEKSLSDEQLAAQFRSKAGAFLGDRIGSGIEEGTRIVYIAGPTGVGKTTTIAKLAADQIFRARKKVGFITADTYRISAVEQLRTYATILNVPLEVVQSPGDVQRAMQRLEDCDLILMDTAGRNYLNEIFVAELHSLLAPSDVSEMYLVLSLTSKTQDMKKITEHFSKYGLDKVIFTKLDETESVGPIYNLLNDYPLKVSYITNGQNVPDDLLQADRELLVDILLGERKL